MMNLYKAEVKTLVVFALLVVAENSYSKVEVGSDRTSTTCSGDVYLSSQAQVDSFSSTYVCNEISGTLTISGNDIVNLDSLHFVTKVDGDLFISNNPNLENISGFSSLTYVGAGGGAYPGIHITNNPKLINVNGLSQLTSIKGALEISNNSGLTNLDGLRSLASVGSLFPSYQCLNISNNAALTSLRGLRSIAFLPGPLVISNNAALTNLDGLDSLSSIDGHVGSLTVSGNASLSNIDGLSALTKVSGRYTSVTISNNPSLPNLNGLSSLRQISGGPPASLEISNNNSLQNVDALSPLKISSAQTYLTVNNNPQLASCCGLYNALNIMANPTCYCNPHITISGNGAGCTQSDILAAGPCPVVCSGNITLASQADVDAFPSVHGCSEITGKLIISGANITNIDSLYSLTKVGELLIIANDNLTNLNGLFHLKAVTATCSSIGCGGTNMGFTINNNPLLADIRGLSSLTHIEPDLVISSNPKLTNLGGLTNVVAVNGRLWIEDNALLNNLNGLASLTSIGFYQVGINNNPSLTSLSGLSLITSIPGSLYICNNASLPNLNGLESLTQLSGAGGAVLTINNNTSLTNIDALSSLHSIGGSGPAVGLTISNNPVLANLNGLQSLTEIMGSFYSGTLEITNNASLHEVDGLSSLDTLCGFNLRVTVKDNSALSNVNGLSSIGLSTPRPTIIVNNNPGLTESCGLYGIVSYASNISGGYIDVTGNGAGCTKTEILASGPCTSGSSALSSMIFSAVTDTTMTVSFTRATGNPDGYITLMKAFGSPNPDDAPADGTTYQPGQIIGSSTIVINVGTETSLDVTYLSPDIEYYFDTYSYKISNGYYDYVTGNPLEGIQRTSSSSSSSPSTRMRSPQISKSSDYSEHPSSNEYIRPFPNPFSENVTIPFTTKNQNTFVQIAIYDLMGRRIATVAGQNFDPGYHEVKWERTDNMGSRVSQGLYIYSVKTNEANREMQGMLVAK